MIGESLGAASERFAAACEVAASAVAACYRSIGIGNALAMAGIVSPVSKAAVAESTISVESVVVEKEAVGE